MIAMTTMACCNSQWSNEGDVNDRLGAGLILVAAGVWLAVWYYRQPRGRRVSLRMVLFGGQA